MSLTELSASELSRRIAQGVMAPSEVMSAFLARIDRINPSINSIVALGDRDMLMAEACAMDVAPHHGWLHGLPFAVKDLQSVKGILSTDGFLARKDFIPASDDMLPRRLRAAGAILIGKTNTSEFGLGSHSFNPVHGVTANPYDTRLSAGGSSGGAAAALAARLVPVADGSDMMGSLRNPAAFCNVYGFRPTFGLVSSDPHSDTFLHQLSTDGPMARCPEDLARLLEILAQPSPTNPHARAAEPFAADLNQNPKGMRLGWLGDWGSAYPMEPGILPTCEAALSVFEAMGCTVDALAPPFSAQRLWESWTVLRSWAVAASLAQHYSLPTERALMKPEAIWEVERGLALSAMDIHRASVIRSEWYNALAALFTRFDALILPSAQVWPFPKEWRFPKAINDRSCDTYHRWMEVVIPVSLAGLPALAAPAGFGENRLPTGIQIFGPKGSDRKLLRLGQAYHQATDWPGKCPPVQ
jgi:amidase